MLYRNIIQGDGEKEKNNNRRKKIFGEEEQKLKQFSYFD
jgi:hypothetical protein